LAGLAIHGEPSEPAPQWQPKLLPSFASKTPSLHLAARIFSAIRFSPSVYGMASSKPRTAFISGPLDPTEEYFATHYKPRIDTAIAEGHNFIVGPVRGVDALTLGYLLEKGVEPGRVTV
jgi:hypothetical protein